MTMTNALRARLLDAYYSGVALAPPANVYVALSTTTPNPDGTGFTRPAGGAYADVEITNDATNWPAATVADPAVKENGTVIAFPTPTGSWGEITHWGISETDGGTIVDFAPLTVVRAIGPGSEPVQFAVGALKTRLRTPTI